MIFCGGGCLALEGCLAEPWSLPTKDEVAPMPLRLWQPKVFLDIARCFLRGKMPSVQNCLSTGNWIIELSLDNTYKKRLHNYFWLSCQVLWGSEKVRGISSHWLMCKHDLLSHHCDQNPEEHSRWPLDQPALQPMSCASVLGGTTVILLSRNPLLPTSGS